LPKRQGRRPLFQDMVDVYSYQILISGDKNTTSQFGKVV
jgi:hypothetical protein